MKFKLIASYASQAYISLVGVLFLPIYLRLMGTEAFGLVGFFVMLQAWLQLLDLGLSSSLSREMSTYRAGVLDAKAAWMRIRSLEWLIGLLALSAAAGLIFFEKTIATHWLSFEHLSSKEVGHCIGAMAIAGALRLLMGLYRAGLIGMERQMWVIGAGTLSMTMKFVGVVPFLVYWSPAPLTFFAYQALVGVLELLAFALVMYHAIPRSAVRPVPVWSALRAMLPVAGAMAFMSGMWVFLTQIDKLILSRLLPLKEYGYYTLAVAAAGGVLVLMNPLNQVLQPRMTILASQGRDDELCALYRQTTQLITAAFFALGGTLALFAKPILFAWTGDTQAAEAAAPILFWYGLANALTGVLLMPFMLQFARGYLRLHVIGNVIMGFILVPFLVYAATRRGGVGVGATLLTTNLLFLILWVPRVHRRLLPELGWTWPLRDVGSVAVAVIGFIALVNWLRPPMEGRFLSICLIGTVLLGAMFLGMLPGDRSRRMLVNWIWRRT